MNTQLTRHLPGLLAGLLLAICLSGLVVHAAPGANLRRGVLIDQASTPGANDPFYAAVKTASSPVTHCSLVTPNDNQDLTPLGVPKGGVLYADSAGTIAFIPLNAPSTAPPVVMTFAAGDIKPVVARRVMATGTTVTTIYQLY